MQIVFLDKKTLGGDVDLSPLESLGELYSYDMTAPDETAERIKDAQIVISNKVLITDEIMEGCPKLKLICVAATGTNNVDIAAAGRRNILVCNVSGYSTESVVMHTFAILLSLMEKIAFYDNYVKSGEYAGSNLFTCHRMPFMELYGKTFGIIGLGNIGKGVARVAKAFGCRVIYYSSTGRNNNDEYERVDFDTLVKEADVISVHAPLNDATKGLLNYDAFSKMKKSAYVINVGRGPIIVENDLRRALDEGLIAGAGIDVFEKEPIASDCPLTAVEDNNKIIVTPHIAWASREARQRLIDEIRLNILGYLNNEPRNTVN